MRHCLVLFGLVVVAQPAAAAVRHLKQTRVDFDEFLVEGDILEPSWPGYQSTPGEVGAVAHYQAAWRQIDAGAWMAGLRQLRDLILVSNIGKVPAIHRDTLHQALVDDFVRVYGRLGLVDDAMDDLIAVAGPQRAEEFLEQLGREYLTQDNHRAVLAIFRDLAAHAPPSAASPVFELRIFEALNDSSASAEAVEQAAVVVNALLVLRASGVAGLGAAEDLIEEALRRAAFDYHKRSRRRFGEDRLNDLRWARSLYGHYLRLFPEPVARPVVRYSFFVRFYFAEVLYKLEDYRSAAEQYDRVAELNPVERKEEQIVRSAIEGAVYAHSEIVQQSTAVKTEHQRFLRAAERYLDAFGRNGEMAREIRYRMGRILSDLGHLDRARHILEELVAEASELESSASDVVVESRVRLGVMASSQNDHASAAEYLEAALRSRHDHAEARNHLQKTYLDLGSNETVEGFLRSIGIDAKPKRKGKKPRIMISTTTPVPSGPSLDDLRRVVVGNLGQLRACYQRQLQNQRALEGRVIVRWVIGAQGAVKKATIVDTMLRNRRLLSCVTATIERWRFLPNHGIVEISSPFVFRRRQTSR